MLLSKYTYYQTQLPSLRHLLRSCPDEAEKLPAAYSALAKITYDDQLSGEMNQDRANFLDSSRRDIQNGRKLTVAACVGRLFRRRATEPRDHLYALLGLLAPDERDMIVVDYARPLMEVFHDAMGLFWADTGSLVVATFFSFKREHTPGVPSWVPDLSARNWIDGGADKTLFIRQPSKPPIRAPATRVCKSRMVLELQGFFFDTICEHHTVDFREIYNGNSNLDSLKLAGRRTLAAWARQIPPSHHLNPWNDLKRLKAMGGKVFETLTAGIARLDEPFYNLEWDDLAFLISKPGFITERYYQRIAAALRTRRIYITEAGFVGVGPSTLETGDRVCVPFGMATALVVRPCAGILSTSDEVTIVDHAWLGELDDDERLDRALSEGVLCETTIRFR